MNKPNEAIDLNIEHILSDPALRRELFPVTRDRIYLAHAGVAPLPGPTVNVLHQEVERAGRSQESVEFMAEIAAIRSVSARLLNAAAEEVALLGPTALGLNLVARGIAWQPGDEVVFYADDYPSNVYPWQALAQSQGVVPVPVVAPKLGEITPDLVFAALTPRTKLVALASCHFLSGYRIDYETIGEELQRRNILFCLDAIQSLGATTIDVRHVDFLAADSHKWMLGPLGAGLFYVKKRRFEQLQPALLGSWNIRSPGYVAQPQIVFEESARRYEPGALNMLGLFGMKASLEMILALGVKQIEARLLDLRAFAEERLQTSGFPVLGYANRRSQKSAITTIGFADEKIATAHHRRLRESGIDVSLRQTRTGLSCLRLSPHFYNTEEEIEATLKILLSSTAHPISFMVPPVIA